MTTVTEHLEKTKEILAQRGRCTGSLIDEETGECCLLGAVGLAVYGDKFEDRPNYNVLSRTEAQRVIDALADEIPDPNVDFDNIDNTWLFNDRTNSDGEVFAVINLAIESYK